MKKFLTDDIKEKIAEFITPIVAEFAFVDDYKSDNVKKNNKKYTYLIIRGCLELSELEKLKQIADSSEIIIATTSLNQVNIYFSNY